MFWEDSSWRFKGEGQTTFKQKTLTLQCYSNIQKIGKYVLYVKSGLINRTQALKKEKIWVLDRNWTHDLYAYNLYLLLVNMLDSITFLLIPKNPKIHYVFEVPDREHTTMIWIHFKSSINHRSNTSIGGGWGRKRKTSQTTMQMFHLKLIRSNLFRHIAGKTLG